MRRRDFISVIGGAAAWPVAVRGQAAMPVIGFVNAASVEGYARPVSAFLKGLADVGYVDGGNVRIEFRWADNRIDQLPALVADLIHRQVTVIAATSTPAALAAKAADTTIPIVFETGDDPVQIGLVPSLSRPGGHVTGVTQTNVEIFEKEIQLLHEVVPAAKAFALLVNPSDAVLSEANSKQALAAAQELGLELHILNANNESDYDVAFAKMVQLKINALVIGNGALATGHVEQLAALAARYAIPAVFKSREFAAAGGLMSYGSDIAESYRLAGTYTGRVLKGDKPADLPVQQATRIELRINLKTAKALGITVPIPLLGRADEVIE
jgi:putative tryptophan/tyrosine transport system substrate-binding protein